MNDTTSQEPWYTLEKEVVFQKLGVSESGLTQEDFKKRLKQYGQNTLYTKRAETVPRILLRQLHNPLVYVLLFSTLLALFLQKIADSLIIFGVVVLNTLIGFIQEWKAHRTIKALSAMVPRQTTVMRDNDLQMVHASQIVPGDIVVLQAGDRIPADLRLFSVRNLQCDESALTGESLPVSKKVIPTSENAPLAERKCMAFNGTYVTAGTGSGIVVETGFKTEFGKISALIEKIPPLDTPLSITVRKIAQWITLIILAVSLGLFLIGYLRGTALFEAGFAAIALAVAAIPEGLPAIITIAASIGVHRMARKQAIIRQLPAVEALGSTSVICTDKTGTLTRNEITLQQIWTPSGFSFVSGIGYSMEGGISFQNHENRREEVIELLRAAILCNEAAIDQSSGGWIPFGDPTEIALVIAGRKIGLLEDQLREEWKRIDIIPFESEKRIMATLNALESEKYIFLKGAPEEIFNKCEVIVDAKIHETVDRMARDGMRVLAVAKKRVGNLHILDEKLIHDGFILLGIVGMIDPPRPEVFKALKLCKDAGIQVKMVTGDHPVTATAIAKDLGILGGQKVITGEEINHFDSENWKRVARASHVFARVSPEHKLKLVDALQQFGDVVAMTGDGVNDAPALKKADIGIAMGIKGTEVAKEASDMILADDNFATIEVAVEEGRRVYDNLIKALAFVLPTSMGQALVILIAVLFFPLRGDVILHPMLPVQILWVNLIVAVALSLPLAFEAMEPEIMQRPPRKKNAPVLDGFLIFKTFTVSACMALGTIGLFLWVYHMEMANGVVEKIAVSEGQTTAVTAIMFFQIFYLFNCRSIQFPIVKAKFFSNPYIFIGVAVVLVAQACFIYLPTMHYLFKSSPLGLQSLLFSALVAFLIVPLVALEQLVRRKIKKSGYSRIT
jgi:calcium-translocating P-type ATPase